MANVGANISIKILTIAIGIPIGIATRKMVERVWIAAGPDRPRRAEDDDVQWADAIAWAAITGVGMAIADLLTRKGAEEIYRAVVGSTPDATVKPKASKKVAKAEPKFPEAIAPPS
jgi:hypothetical protein